MNALHKHNSDWVSKHDLILQKYQRLEGKFKDSQAELKYFKAEAEELRKYKSETLAKLQEIDIQKGISTEVDQRRNEQYAEAARDLSETKVQVNLQRTEIELKKIEISSSRPPSPTT